MILLCLLFGRCVRLAQMLASHLNVTCIGSDPFTLELYFDLCNPVHSAMLNWPIFMAHMQERKIVFNLNVRRKGAHI